MIRRARGVLAHRGARVIATLLVVAVFAVLATASLGAIDLGAIRDAFAQADGRLLLGAAAAYLLAQSISGVMWWLCQRAGGAPGLTVWDGLSIHWVSRACCELLPLSMGEAARVALVHLHPTGRDAGLWRIGGALGGYKMVDAVVTSLVVCALVLVLPLPGPAGTLRWAGVGVAGFAITMVVAVRLGAARVPALRLPAIVRRCGTLCAQGAGIFTDRPRLALVSGLAALALVVRLVSLVLLCLALGAPMAAAALVFCAITLVGVIPGAPGGAGLREAALLPALALGYGISASHALAISLSIQALSLGTSIVAGALILSISGRRLLCRAEPSDAAGDAHDLLPQASLEPSPQGIPA